MICNDLITNFLEIDVHGKWMVFMFRSSAWEYIA